MTDEIRTDNTDTFKNALHKIVELTEENEQLKAQIEYAKSVIKSLLDNTDEYCRQRAIDFIKE